MTDPKAPDVCGDDFVPAMRARGIIGRTRPDVGICDKPRGHEGDHEGPALDGRVCWREEDERG